jgi:hypothetical protein
MPANNQEDKLGLFQAEFCFLLAGMVEVFTNLQRETGNPGSSPIYFNAKFNYDFKCLSAGYQKRLPPPNPPRRSSRGRASLTLRARPFKSLPSSPEIADWASELLDISTNPNPLESPLNLSVMILTDVTCPKAPKACLKSSSVASRGKFPT